MSSGLANLIPEHSFQLDCNTVGAEAAQNDGGGIMRKRRQGKVVDHSGSNDWSSFLISEY